MYKALFIAGIVLAIAPWMYHSQLDWKARSLMATLDSLQSKVERMSAEIKRHHATLKDQEKEAEQLDNENRLLYEQLKARGDDVSYLENSEDRDAYYESEISEEAFLERIDGIESAFQKKCKQMVVSKFGVGPYLVNVTVQENLLATDPKERRKRAWFVVEMAPLSLMPHAVDHFLRLMDLGVWNGLTLIHSTENSVNFNDGDSSFIQPSPKLIYSSEMAADMSSSTLKSHTTVAATVVVEGSDTSNHYKRAAKGHLTQLAFTEQSPDYPIEKYSGMYSHNKIFVLGITKFKVESLGHLSHRLFLIQLFFRAVRVVPTFTSTWKTILRVKRTRRALARLCRVETYWTVWLTLEPMRSHLYA